MEPSQILRIRGVCMSRILTALGAKEYKVGDEVVFFTTPSKHQGSDPELRDVRPRAVAKVVGVTIGFTGYGPKEFVPYYDVLLPDGKVVKEVSPHYFEIEWPKMRNDLDTAFNRVMKALKPLGLSRVRSNVRAGERTLQPQLDKPISVKRVVSLLEEAGIAVDNNGYFTVEVQVTKSGKHATYRGRVHKGVPDDDVLLGVSFGFSPEVDHFLSGRYASRKKGTTAPRALTASDRSSLIRLASGLPKGSEERRTILSGLLANTAPTEVLMALVLHSGEDLKDARRRFDLLEEDFERVGMTSVVSALKRMPQMQESDREVVLGYFRGLESSTSRSGSYYRMEAFEEVEGFVARLRRDPAWNDVRKRMNEALHFMGRGEPFNDMEEALRQVTLAQAALEKAVSHLRVW